MNAKNCADVPMTGNRIERGWIGQAPAVPLEVMADDLNRCNFSFANGWRWHVQTRKVENGASVRELTRTDQQGFSDWKPEPGEREWIERATAEYAKRFPDRNPLAVKADRLHFSEIMNRWHCAAPWRQNQ